MYLHICIFRDMMFSFFCNTTRMAYWVHIWHMAKTFAFQLFCTNYCVEICHGCSLIFGSKSIANKLISYLHASILPRWKKARHFFLNRVSCQIAYLHVLSNNEDNRSMDWFREQVTIDWFREYMDWSSRINMPFMTWFILPVFFDYKYYQIKTAHWLPFRNHKSPLKRRPTLFYLLFRYFYLDVTHGMTINARMIWTFVVN